MFGAMLVKTDNYTGHRIITTNINYKCHLAAGIFSDI